ncbi:MAG: hypothetical protein ABSD64_13125 [Terriglobales bacterium]
MRLFLLLLLSAVVFPLSGCLFRTRTLDRQLSDRPLKAATQQELIEFVNREGAKIQSLQATVDIDASSTDLKNGKATDYKEIRGYVLARKPAMLRMKGLLPVVRNTAFDMVSNGREFKVSIPPRNKFVMGSNDAENYQPTHRLESLRPQYVYDALLLPEISQDEIAALENGYETVLDSKKHRVEQPNYRLLVIRKGPQGWYLARRIEFSRIDLLPYQQTIYDQHGNVATDVHYQDYKDYADSQFPSTIRIERPREGYDIILHMIKLEINKALTDDQFALEQPSGAEVVRIDPANANAATTPSHQSQ